MKFNLFFVFLGVISIVYIYNNVKNDLHWEKDSIMWISGALIILVLSTFPRLIDCIAYKLKIYYPPSLLFLLAIIFLFYIVFKQSKQISSMNKKIRELAQSAAILEKEASKLRE
ncbi:MAG: DUF2304 domain-containing protein [Bacillota bacterium]|nr:DUF2304 domain-containing protein [Bacillota bacterium]